VLGNPQAEHLCHLAVFAPTLSPEGRQRAAAEVLASIEGSQWFVADLRVIAAAGGPLRLGHVPNGLTRVEELVSQRNPIAPWNVHTLMATVGTEGANDIIESFLASTGAHAAGDGPSRAWRRRRAIILAWCSFVWRLPWTQRAPAAWWWPLLEEIRMVMDDAPLFYSLPASFLPVERLVRWLDISPDPETEVSEGIMYSAAANPEIVASALVHLGRYGEDELRFIAARLRVRQDLDILRPHLLPVLLGHLSPALATLGLEFATNRALPRTA
jgi:hypothetical protein